MTDSFWDTLRMSKTERTNLVRLHFKASGDMARIGATSRKVIDESHKLIRRTDRILARDGYPNPMEPTTAARHWSFLMDSPKDEQ